jgi:uncharacterized membrane protein YphA (DoxX/SURF4 family)
MSVPSRAKWPHRRTLALTAIALLLAMGSMQSVGSISRLLAAAAVIVGLVAAARLWWFWRWPRGHSGNEL